MNFIGKDKSFFFKLYPEMLLVTVFDPKTRAKKDFSKTIYSHGLKPVAIVS